MLRAVALILLNLIALPAVAGTLSFVVVDAKGQPISNAVVLAPEGSLSGEPIRFDWKYEMSQQDRMFQPHVLIVPRGSTVGFPNHDRFRHHVYSFSKGNRFEIELYGRDESRTVQFSHPGIIAVGCNIHDDMLGYIHVVDTQYVGQSGADGMVEMSLPVVGNTLQVWTPSAPQNYVSIPLPPTGEDSLELVFEAGFKSASWRPAG